MDRQNKFIEKRKMKFNYEGKFFLYGVLVGIIFLFSWNLLLDRISSFNNNKEEFMIEQLKMDSEQMLLNYVDGKWVSSIKDLEVTIDIDRRKEFVVIENTIGKPKLFKIIKLTKVNGILGIIRLELCDVRNDCSNEVFHIPIQLNKVFGIDRTISITYDSRFTYCSEEEDRCVRAFRRHI